MKDRQLPPAITLLATIRIPLEPAADGKNYYSSAKFRVTAGSTGIPGPVVVETVTFFR